MHYNNYYAYISHIFVLNVPKLTLPNHIHRLIQTKYTATFKICFLPIPRRHSRGREIWFTSFSYNYQSFAWYDKSDLRWPATFRLANFLQKLVAQFEPQPPWPGVQNLSRQFAETWNRDWDLRNGAQNDEVLKIMQFSVNQGRFPQSVIRGRFPHSHL